MKIIILGILFLIWAATGIFFAYNILNNDECMNQKVYRTKCMDKVLDNALDL